MEKTICARVNQKIDTDENWSTNNPVLSSGEIAFVVTTNDGVRMKVGDGESNYSQLNFFDDAIRNIISSLNFGFVESEADM